MEKLERITEKLVELEQFIKELRSIIPKTFEEFGTKEKAASERYFEKIVECITKITFLIIKEEKYSMPLKPGDGFLLLSSHKIINEELSQKLRSARSMRNVIVHNYEELDNKKVYTAIKWNLLIDAKQFLQEVRKWLS